MFDRITAEPDKMGGVACIRALRTPDAAIVGLVADGTSESDLGRGAWDLMILDLSNLAVYLRPGHCDMRKAINGLLVIVAESMEQDPLSGTLYLFCNRLRRILKCLYWDRNGFCLW